MMMRFSISRHEDPMLSFLAAAALLIGLVCVLWVPVSTGADMNPEAKALVKLDDEWSAAAATRDAKRVASFYAEDAIAYPPNESMAVGRAAAEKTWAAYFADPSYQVSWKTTYAEVSGDLGYTAGTYEDSYVDADGRKVTGKGKYLCVWKKQSDGTWKAVHDMWNSDM